jgi:hypothetical protein
MVLILLGFLIVSGFTSIWVYKSKQPRKISAFICVPLLALFLSVIYVQYIAVWYDYQGFTLSLSWENVLFSIILILITVYLMPVATFRASDLLVQIWYLIGYIPILLFYMLNGEEINYVIFVSICFGILIFFQRNSFTFKIPNLKQAYLGYLLILFILVYTYGVLISSHGFVFNLSILDVYDIRSEYVGFASVYPFLSYFVVWQGYVINPMLLSICLKHRKYLLSTIVLLLFFLLFSITGFKNLLTGAFFVVLILFFIKRQNSLSLLSSGLSLLVVGSGVITELTGRIEFVSIAARRLFFLPARLNFIYYEYFSVNPKTNLGYSIFSSFVDYPYELPPSGIIASYLDPSKNSGANAGFLADAYANFGFVGMVVFTLILVLMLRLMDSISKGRDWRFVSIALVMPFFALVNSGLLTTLLSHGFLFALLLYWVIHNRDIFELKNLKKFRFVIKANPTAKT